MSGQRAAWALVSLAVLVGAGVLWHARSPGAAGGPSPATIGPGPLAAARQPNEQPGTPAALLALYVEADFRGERLERANWPTKFKPLVIWSAEPAWETAYVVRGYRLQPQAPGARTAEVDCRYDTLGELTMPTFAYSPSPTRQTVPYKLEQRPGEGWRIAFPQLQPHVGVRASVAFLQRMAVGYPRQRAAIATAIAAIEQQDRASARP